MLLVQLFGWEIDNTLFVFSITALAGFAWWLTAIYYNLKQVKEATEIMKDASLKRGRQLDIVIIKNEALTETLGTEGIQLGKIFNAQFTKKVESKIREYEIETS